ncbi:glycosyltransferase family 9 protein [Shewanella sp. YIC-542]|uniref:glycosyltransferase family 9 protein n=1 Tax=Shewanella mytili TaxID=3377111 RepID=UPI00398F84BD
MKQPTFLFIPVSSAQGIGEFARSVIIAEGVKKRWPHADIHFILSREAPYRDDCPFTTHLVNQSPTKETSAVNALIQSLQPDVVVFDASGRAQQLACAKKCGAKVVFISQHRKKRARGLKISRARHTDLHWVVQPDYVMAPVSLWQQCKLKALHLPKPQNIGVIYATPEQAVIERVLQRHHLTAQQYFIVNAGSGGHLLGKQLAADVFAQVAQAVHQLTQLPVIFIYGANYPGETVTLPGVETLDTLKNDEFIALLQNARGAVLSGGGTVLQAIAMQVPTLAVAVAKDQADRIAACEKHGLILTAPAEADAMVEKLTRLINPQTQEMLRQQMCQQHHMNGLQIALDELQTYMK